MLANINPPAYRFEVAQDWLAHNEGKCGYGAMIWVQNRGAYVLGTAWQQALYVQSWTLMAPEAKKTQAMRKKRRL